jgi:PAS domain S-box-containing protein
MTDPGLQEGLPRKVPSLLLVEDEPVIGLVEKATLERAGYAVTHVLSGEAALAEVDKRDQEFDLVLMDMDLGRGIDGTEAARRILEGHDLPVVFVSAHSEPEIVEKAERITNYGYILKNAGDTVLLASVRMAFRLHDAYTSLERKDKALQLSQEQYAKAFHASPIPSLIIRQADSVIIDVNESFEETFGWTKEEAIGNTGLGLRLWPEPAGRELVMGRLAAERRIRNLELVLRHKDGSLLHGNSSFELLDINGEECILAMAENLTPHRALDLALKDREAHYRVLFDELSSAVLEEDFSEVKAFIDGLTAQGVTDLETWFKQHLEAVRDLVSKIHIVRFNQEYLGILNAKSREQVAKTLTPYVPDEALHVVIEEFLGLIEGRRPVEIACRNFIPGSPTEFLKLRLSLVTGHEKDWSRVLISFVDITKEVKAEASLQALLRQKDVLMRELEHRVKNNLNIVSSLLSLEASKIKATADRAVFLSAQSRIQSISLIYDLLSHAPSVDHIDCRNYLGDLVGLLWRTFGSGRKDIAIGLEVVDFELDMRRGVSLGLLVNELVTNALKYAFPLAGPAGKAGGGQVAVSLARTGPDLVLTVSDNGVGLPEAFSWAEAPSLGAHLVDMLVQQLGGRLELRGGPGFTAVIAFPAEA